MVLQQLVVDRVEKIREVLVDVDSQVAVARVQQLMHIENAALIDATENGILYITLVGSFRESL